MQVGGLLNFGQSLLQYARDNNKYQSQDNRPQDNVFKNVMKYVQLSTFVNVSSLLFAGQKIVRNLRASVFSSILRQEVAFFDRNRTGELINRLSADTTVVGRSITDNLSDGLRAVAQAAAGVSMMVSMILRVVRCGW